MEMTVVIQPSRVSGGILGHGTIRHGEPAACGNSSIMPQGASFPLQLLDP